MTRGGSRGRGGPPNQVNTRTRITRNNPVGPAPTPVALHQASNSAEMCSFCSTVVGNDAVGCDKCAAWFHPKTQCTGLSSRAIECIQSEGGDGVRFVCSACRCASSTTAAGGSHSSSAAPDNEALSQLHQIVKSLAESIALLTTKVNTLCNAGQGTINHERQGIFNRESLFTEMREFDERRKRRESIIVKGFRTTTDPLFVNAFTDISRALINRTVTPENVYCINRDTGMYRVTVSDNEVRRNILSESKRLKDISEYRQVYISRDLTYMQRQEERTRRAERVSRLYNEQGGNSGSSPSRVDNVASRALSSSNL